MQTRERTMKKPIFIFIAVVLIVAAGAFYGGMKYNQSKNHLSNFTRQNFQNMTPEQRQQMLQGNIGGNAATRRTGSNFVSGEIISKDNNSLTVKLPDGGSKIIFLSASTTISKMTQGSANEIEVGKQITVSGIQNSDGSYTANNIQIRQ
jgi:flagellar basal body-associated protein FliL